MLWWGQRSCRGQPGSTEVQMLRYALWPPSLVGRTPEQSVMHCWVKGHAGVSRGQPKVTMLRYAVWPSNMLGRTPDQSVMHCWGQRLCRGQPGSTSGQIALNALGYQIWWKEPPTKVKCIAGQRSCMGQPESTRGQIDRKFPMATRFGNNNPWPECNTLPGSKVMHM